MLEQLQNNRNALGLAVHAAGGGAAAAVPDLSARPGHLAGLHRRQDRPAGRVDRAGELRLPVRRHRHAAGAVQHALLHGGGERLQVRARPVAGAAARTSNLPLQDLLPRGHPAALHRADRAVGDRLLVDLRRAVLDHQLGAHGTGPDRPLHRLPRRPVECALVDDRRQRLARRAVRRDHAARRSADDLAVALRSLGDRRRHAVAAVPARHAAAADADHRGGDDLLGAVHLHRLPADLRAHARRAAERHAPDGHAVVPARDLRRCAGRRRGDRDRDGAVPAGAIMFSYFGLQRTGLATRAATNERRKPRNDRHAAACTTSTRCRGGWSPSTCRSGCS